MLLALVLLVCGLLAVIGTAGYLQSAGTGRAFGRVLSTRSAVEAGDAALAEAAALVRLSMDTGAGTAACPDDWHDVVFRAIQGTPGGQVKLDPEGGTTHKVKPLVTRAKISSDEVPVTIDDVTAKILSCYAPPQNATAAPQNPPQGILELSVAVHGPGKVFDVVRTVRQRRLFYASIRQQLVLGMQVQANDVMVFLTIDPIGTVIE